MTTTAGAGKLAREILNWDSTKVMAFPDARHNALARAVIALTQQRDAARAEAEAWTETARLHAKNESFWRDLVMETGRILGGRVYVQDDGGIVDRPLGLRVPEVAAALLAELAALRDNQRSRGTIEVCSECRGPYELGMELGVIHDCPGQEGRACPLGIRTPGEKK